MTRPTYARLRPTLDQLMGRVRLNRSRTAGIAAIFVAMELCLLAMIGSGMYALGGMRAYGSGESLWSKAQKDAILHLRNYIETGQPADLQAYQANVDITLADRAARLELDKPNPDVARVRELVQSKQNPSDVSALAWLFRTFRHAAQVERAVNAWAEGDFLIDQLQEVAATEQAGTPAVPTSVVFQRLQTINDQATTVEIEFSDALAEAAARVRRILLCVAVAATTLFLGFGSVAMWVLARRWKKADAAARARLQLGEERLRRALTVGKQAEAALRLSQQRLQSVLDRAPILAFAVDTAGFISVAQGSALQSVGLERDQLIGRSFFDLFAGAPALVGSILRALAGDTVHDQNTWADRDFECTLTPIVDADGTTVMGVSGVAFDVTDRSRAQAQLQQQATRLAEQAALLDLAHDGILVWELRTGAIQFWNRGAEDLYGWTRAEVFGRTPSAVLHTQFPRPLSDINAELVSNGYWEGELVHTRRDGSPIVVASRWALQLDARGEPHAVVAINRDMSERKKAEQALAYQARHDALTALPNRMQMQESLAATLDRLQSHGTPLALLLLDLDRFKDVNDTLGHGTGDLVLQQVAERLHSAVRPSDTIARFGGDEFAVLLPGAQRATAMEVAERLRDKLAQPFEINGMRIDLGGSVGVALGPEHGADADTLLRRADVAMYAAKRSGTCVAVYEPVLETDNSARLRELAERRAA